MIKMVTIMVTKNLKEDLKKTSQNNIFNEQN